MKTVPETDGLIRDVDVRLGNRYLDRKGKLINPPNHSQTTNTEAGTTHETGHKVMVPYPFITSMLTDINLNSGLFEIIVICSYSYRVEFLVGKL